MAQSKDDTNPHQAPAPEQEKSLPEAKSSDLAASDKSEAGEQEISKSKQKRSKSTKNRHPSSGTSPHPPPDPRSSGADVPEVLGVDEKEAVQDPSGEKKAETKLPESIFSPSFSVPARDTGPINDKAAKRESREATNTSPSNDLIERSQDLSRDDQPANRAPAESRPKNAAEVKKKSDQARRTFSSLRAQVANTQNRLEPGLPAETLIDPALTGELPAMNDKGQPLSEQEKQEQELQRRRQNFAQTYTQMSALRVAQERTISAIAEAKPPEKEKVGNPLVTFTRHPIISGAITLSLLAVMLTGIYKVSSTFKQSYSDGLAFMHDRDYRSAIRAFDRDLSVNPEWTAVLIKRGYCHSALGQYKNALTDFSKVLTIQPNNTEALNMHAMMSQCMGDTDTAFGDYEKLLKIIPFEDWKDSNSLIQLANTYISDEKYEKALSVIQRCLETNPSDTTALGKRAECYMRLNKPKQALVDLNSVLKTFPDSAELLRKRAECHDQLEDYTSAQADIDRALKLEPNSAHNFRILAEHYAKQGKSDDALGCLNKAISIDPNDQNSYVARIKTLQSKGKYSDALADVQTVRNMPNFALTPKFLSVQSRLLAQSNNLVAAVACLDEAIKLHPNDTAAYQIDLADLYGSQKDYKKALDFLNTIISDNPKNFKALYKHAYYSHLNGSQITAQDDIFKILAADPLNAEALCLRGDINMEAKNYASAAEDFKAALSRSPGLKNAKAKLAECDGQIKKLGKTTQGSGAQTSERPALSKAELASISQMDFSTLMQKGYDALKQYRGDYAVAAFKRAISLNPSDSSAHRYLLHAELAQGDIDDASAEFQNILRLPTQSAESVLDLAKAIAESGNASAAAAAYESLIQRYARDSEALKKIASICANSGLTDQGLKACDVGLKLASAKGQVDDIGDFNSLRSMLSKEALDKFRHQSTDQDGENSERSNQ